MPRAAAPERNTRRQNDFLARGKAAALAGVGIGDGDALQAALTEACGPYALSDRSAWLVGHEQGVRAMDARANDIAFEYVSHALRAAGFTLTPARWGRLLLGIDGVAITITHHQRDTRQPAT